MSPPVWAAASAAFFRSRRSLIFVSALFFGGGRLAKEYWGNICLSKYLHQKHQSTSKIGIPIPPYKEVIDFISLLRVFKNFDNAVIKMFRVRGRICARENCRGAQGKANLEKGY